jgi:hypothetical protein
VSFGIHIIAEEYLRQLNSGGRPSVSFAEANRITFRPGRDGRRVFAGYDGPPWTEPWQKLELLERQLERHGASCPLVIGNSLDESAMAARARELGGLSIGFRPTREAAQHFDLVVRAASWSPLFELVSDALG